MSDYKKAEKELKKLMRSPRIIKGYPRREVTLVKRLSRSNIKQALVYSVKPRIHARAWRVRTRQDIQMDLESRAAQGILGSLEERIFYKALQEHNFIPGVDFTFQSSMMGGRAEFGGLVADFLFPVPKIIVNPTSVWHTMTLENVRRDDDQTQVLGSMGYMVLYLDPGIIHDAAALNWWMERNLSHLWGTSYQPLGGGGVRNITWLEAVWAEQHIPLLIGMLDDILRVLR